MTLYELNMQKTEEERRQIVIQNNRRLDKARKGQLIVGAVFVGLSLVFDFQLWIAGICLVMFSYYRACASACMDCPICGRRPMRKYSYGPQSCPNCGTDLTVEE